MIKKVLKKFIKTIKRIPLLLKMLVFKKNYDNIEKLDLCSLKTTCEGYTSLSKDKKSDIQYDLTYLPMPIKSNTVKTIFFSHGLYYFIHNHALEILKDCWRILKKGGLIRVLVVDLEIFAKAYVNKDRKFLFQKIKETNQDRFAGKTLGDKFIGQAYYYGGVKYVYDFESLKEILKKAGFKKIKNCKYRESRIPEIDKLDNRPELTLFVEAEK